MRQTILLVMGVTTVIACGGSSTDPEKAGNEKGSNSGSATASGIIYGFTAAPDSQRIELAGATVSLIRVGDLVPPGPDTTESPPPPPPGPDTTLMTSMRLKSLLDTVVTPETLPPPPPQACGLGVSVATVVTGSDGRWSATGLEEGVYNVQVEPPAGSQWRGIEYCGFMVQPEQENSVTLYLWTGPGPDPVP